MLQVPSTVLKQMWMWIWLNMSQLVEIFLKNLKRVQSLTESETGPGWNWNQKAESELLNCFKNYPTLINMLAIILKDSHNYKNSMNSFNWKSN